MNYKIKDIEILGDYDTRRITTNDKWSDTVLEFSSENICLPSWFELSLIDDDRNLWLLLKDYVITIEFKNGSFLQFKFRRGMLWDQASVPIFKNNDVQEILAALIHDALFSLHLLFPNDNNRGFRAANKLFKAITFYSIDKLDRNWFQKLIMKIKARGHFRVVNSIFGRARYETDSPRRAFWHKQVVEWDCSRPGDWL